MNPKYTVWKIDGSFTEFNDWTEADELARKQSRNGVSILVQDTDGTKILYYDGDMYIKMRGRLCEHCLKVLPEHDAHYSYSLTEHFFCSQECGVKLGILKSRNGE